MGRPEGKGWSGSSRLRQEMGGRWRRLTWWRERLSEGKWRRGKTEVKIEKRKGRRKGKKMQSV